MKGKTERFKDLIERANIKCEEIESKHYKKIAIYTTSLTDELLSQLYFVGFNTLTIRKDLEDNPYFVLNY